MKIKLSIDDIWLLRDAMSRLPFTGSMADIEAKLRKAEKQHHAKLRAASGGGMSPEQIKRLRELVDAPCANGHVPNCSHRNPRTGEGWSQCQRCGHWDDSRTVGGDGKTACGNCSAPWD